MSALSRDFPWTVFLSTCLFLDSSFCLIYFFSIYFCLLTSLFPPWHFFSLLTYLFPSWRLFFPIDISFSLLTSLFPSWHLFFPLDIFGSWHIFLFSSLFLDIFSLRDLLLTFIFLGIPFFSNSFFPITSFPAITFSWHLFALKPFPLHTLFYSHLFVFITFPWSLFLSTSLSLDTALPWRLWLLNDTQKITWTQKLAHSSLSPHNYTSAPSTKSTILKCVWKRIVCKPAKSEKNVAKQTYWPSKWTARSNRWIAKHKSSSAQTRYLGAAKFQCRGNYSIANRNGTMRTATIQLYFILFSPALLSSALLYSILLYSFLFYSILFCSALSYAMLFYSVLFYSIVL